MRGFSNNEFTSNCYFSAVRLSRISPFTVIVFLAIMPFKKVSFQAKDAIGWTSGAASPNFFKYYRSNFRFLLLPLSSFGIFLMRKFVISSFTIVTHLSEASGSASPKADR